MTLGTQALRRACYWVPETCRQLGDPAVGNAHLPSLPTAGFTVPADFWVKVRGVDEMWIPENKTDTPFKWYLAEYHAFPL